MTDINQLVTESIINEITIGNTELSYSGPQKLKLGLAAAGLGLAGYSAIKKSLAKKKKK